MMGMKNIKIRTDTNTTTSQQKYVELRAYVSASIYVYMYGWYRVGLPGTVSGTVSGKFVWPAGGSTVRNS